MILVLAMILVFLMSAMRFMLLLVVNFMLGGPLIAVLRRGVAAMLIVVGMCGLLAA